MLTDNLFNSVLIEPVNRGCNKLFVVSGYATSAMAFHHLTALKALNASVNIKLIVGMCAQDGLSESNHRGFQHLVDTDFQDVFECSYAVNLPPVHSKVYAWFMDDEPMFGFAGSANYTQTAFSNSQREVMVRCPPEDCFGYFESLSGDTIYCNHTDAENIVTIYKDQTYQRLLRQKIITADNVPDNFVLHGLSHVRVSLLDRQGNLPARSGLNWGQRPELGREPNQAYIRLSVNVYSTDFFPERGVHFTVNTDDGKVLICTRAQDNGKGIHTPHNNSLIGRYFRNRLGLASGAFVRKEDLSRYGRTHVDFYKIDNETYYMDFSNG